LARVAENRAPWARYRRDAGITTREQWWGL
jgi:hypothetical protein